MVALQNAFASELRTGPAQNLNGNPWISFCKQVNLAKK